MKRSESDEKWMLYKENYSDFHLLSSAMTMVMVVAVVRCMVVDGFRGKTLSAIDTMPVRCVCVSSTIGRNFATSKIDLCL